MRDELALTGSDPFLWDTDGDGFSDGDEFDDSTDPLNPASFDQQQVWTVGSFENFDVDAGGATGTGSWEHGAPGSGPVRAHSGSSVWATNLAGNYGAYERSYLYLPPVNLQGVSDGVLFARVWLSATNGDGLLVERRGPDGIWRSVAPLFREYEEQDALGRAAWRTIGYLDQYLPVALDLSPFAGSVATLRLSFRTDLNYAAPGAYIDDIAISSESADSDGDGFLGIASELAAGTDPFNDDSDGDTFSDGDEVAAGSDPSNPADAPGVTMIAVGDTLDFDDGPSGLATDGTLWEHGGVGSGPLIGYEGVSAWATNLTGNYSANLREFLYLPPVDLTSATEPVLAMRIWVSGTNGDGVSVERYEDGVGWSSLTPLTPFYDQVDGLGNPAWRAQAPFDKGYTLALLPLSADTGGVAKLRLAFRSDLNYAAPGAYIDEIGVYEEASDPDNDNLVGVYGEFETHGTDPLKADSDGDGHDDGAEVSGGTHANNPADYPGVSMIAPGDLLDFDDGPSGFVGAEGLWEHGGIGSGPGAGYQGASAWATSRSGNYDANRRAFLYFPPVDLRTAIDPVLAMRIWVGATNGDGVSVERYVDGGGWQAVTPHLPAYDAVDALGFPAWRTQTPYDGGYTLALLPLSGGLGEVVRLRLAFRSDLNYTAAGAYVDDVGVFEEGVDVDSDGVVGVYDEFLAFGTDPLVADTDGDGVDDGTEVGAATDPLNPVEYDGAPTLSVGGLLDLELDDGGLVGVSGWDHGSPGSGPGVAHSGTRVWATNLAGNYAANRRDPLLLPLLDLNGTTSPILTFRLWIDATNGDGLGFEAEDLAGEWSRLLPIAPSYESTDALGVVAWRNQGTGGDYVLAAFDLAAWRGRELPTRLMFRTDLNYAALGAYIDDIGLEEATADPDTDGLDMDEEIRTYGTDPYVSDTDGDGVNDGTEVGGSTDPLDALDF